MHVYNPELWPFPPDWCQLIFKWPCCRDRKSRSWSSVWVSWPLYCQLFLPDLNIIPLLGPHSDSSSSLISSVNGVQTDSCFIRALGSQSWHLLCCAVTSWSGNGSKITLQNPYLFLIRRWTDSILFLWNFQISVQRKSHTSHWTKYRFQEYINEFALISTLLISLTQMFWIFCLSS